MADEKDGRPQGAHWRTTQGQAAVCTCDLGIDHDADGNDVSASPVPQRHETGE